MTSATGARALPGAGTRVGAGASTWWAMGADEEELEHGGAFSLVVDARSLGAGAAQQRRTAYGSRTGAAGYQRGTGGVFGGARGKRQVPGGINWQAKRPAGQKTQQRGFRRGAAGQRRWNDWGGGRDKRKVTASIDIKPEWGDPVLTIDFATLHGARAPVPAAETLDTYGALERFNSAYTRITARQEKPLERQWAVERKFYQVTTSDDPVLSALLEEQAAKAREGGGLVVYATDAIVTTLMTALKSHFSWDVIVRKRQGVLTIDKRDESGLDLVTVNENSHEPPGDEAEIAANTQDALTKEATLINLNASQQLLDHDADAQLPLAHPHPFAEPDEKAASVGYLYRRFALNDAGDALVVRCEVDAYKPRAKDAGTGYVIVRALNEYDVKVTGGWRQKLEAQRAGTFATEVRNNNCKLHKWALQAHLAEADSIALAYVSRTTMRDPYSHVLLGVEERARTDFLRDLGADVSALWGVLMRLVDLLRSLPDDATYLLVREPNKKQLSIYRVKDDDFATTQDTL